MLLRRNGKPPKVTQNHVKITPEVMAKSRQSHRNRCVEAVTDRQFREGIYCFGWIGGLTGVTVAAGEVGSMGAGVACAGIWFCAGRAGGGGALISIASLSSS